MKKLCFLILLPFSLLGQDCGVNPCCEDPCSRVWIEQERFCKVQEMFNPWYSGPLLLGTATMMPKGWGNIQTHVFVADHYKRYDEDRNLEKVPTKFTFNPVFAMQAGVTDWLDTTFLIQTVTNWQQDRHGGSVGDTLWQIGFPIAQQTMWVPAIKASVTETFPTGRYRNLKSNRFRTDATGQGSYFTTFKLAFSKIFFWCSDHPMNFRMTFGYGLGTRAKVENFNTYGGGFGTDGKVRPGNLFRADFGAEISITKRWVFTTDLMYVAIGRNKFVGFRGLNANGTTAVVGSGSSDELSIAPAFEYRPACNLWLIGGGWVSLYGRNTLNFGTAYVGLTYTFNFFD